MHPCLCAHCLAAGQAAKLPQSLPGSASVLGFANPPHARRCIWPYRVHHFLNYGLVVRFRLPSTPSLDDAVAFSYGQPVLCPTGTLTPLLVRTFRRTEGRPPCRPTNHLAPITRRKNGTARRPSLPELQWAYSCKMCSCRTQKRPAFPGYSCSCHPRNEKQLAGATSFS